MPVLIKTRGKTTTDHISPTGMWLRYRGHLERFSENLLLGATNAATGEVGKTSNVISGASRPADRRGRPRLPLERTSLGDRRRCQLRRRQQPRARRPISRLLGGAAVIARSFARIHESNLKKQGLLALTFTHADDYERIRGDDRLSLLGLQELAAGKPVKCRPGTLGWHRRGPRVEAFLQRAAARMVSGGLRAQYHRRHSRRPRSHDRLQPYNNHDAASHSRRLHAGRYQQGRVLPGR